MLKMSQRQGLVSRHRIQFNEASLSSPDVCTRLIKLYNNSTSINLSINGPTSLRFFQKIDDHHGGGVTLQSPVGCE